MKKIISVLIKNIIIPGSVKFFQKISILNEKDKADICVATHIVYMEHVRHVARYKLSYISNNLNFNKCVIWIVTACFEIKNLPFITYKAR